jgi:autotransporter adhesin
VSGANSVALGAGSRAAEAGVVSVGSGDGVAGPATRRITNVGAGVVSATSTDAVNGSQLNTINNTAVFYTDATRTAVTLGDGSTPVKLSNVATGTDDTDAVNVAQLNQVTQGVSDNAGQLADAFAAIGGGAGISGGIVTMPTFSIQGISYHNVGDALGGLDSAVSGALASIQDMRGDISQLQHQPVTSGSGTGSNPRVAVDGASGGGDNATAAAGSKGVAVGSGAAAGGSKGTAIGGDAYAAGPNDTAVGGNAKVHADGSTAYGANANIAAAATNAVAVGESASVTAASGVAVGQGASVTAVGAIALGQGSVADRANTVSVGTAANNRQVTNVAAGTQATDAANFGQVQEALVTAKTYSDTGDAQTLSQAKAYTDQKVSAFASSSDLNTLRDQVADQFHTVDKRINQVGAMGTAMAQMAFSTQGIDTDNRMGVGVGGYHGEGALSVGYSRRLSPKANLTFGAAVSGNEASGGVGLGIGW